MTSRKRSSGFGRGVSPRLPQWPIDLQTKASLGSTGSAWAGMMRLSQAVGGFLAED